MNDLTVDNNIEIINRREFKMSGVSDVGDLTESSLVLYAENGEINVKGENFKVRKIDTDSGEFEVEGKIQSLVFSEKLPRHSGIFARLLK